MNIFHLAGIRQEGADEEERLVKAAAGGNEAAFESLKRVHETALLRFIARRVGPVDADDVAQEAWMAVWQNLKKWNRHARFKAWLFAIAEHKCVDLHRARSRQNRSDRAGEIEEVVSPAHDAYAVAELRETVRSLLALLPSNQREVVEHYYFDELTLAEIAQLLGRNLNTVKYQFYRAHACVSAGLSTAHPDHVEEARDPSETEGPGAGRLRGKR
ncbi:MAG: RNA polymerase sigma factor [Capsulimonadaceae bacterium]